MELISKDSLWKEFTTRIEEYADIADLFRGFSERETRCLPSKNDKYENRYEPV